MKSQSKDSDLFPKPGNGYTIRQFLGSGAWKDAYRASSSYSLSDRALLFFHKGVASQEAIRDVVALMRTQAKEPWSSYLADVYGYHYSPDRQLFIAEELLARPLDRAGKIRDRLTFARVARDLSRGLHVIHDLKLVHRDLKLDNCGLDNHGRAKIFDLGSVTSEPGGIQGSILTRAPELIVGDQKSTNRKATPASDVWSLGATLFALRVGVYPFVTEAEAKARKFWNDEFREGRVARDKRDQEKGKIDSVIVRRIQETEAEQKLHVRLKAEFRGSALETMTKMLSFEPDRRPEAKEIEKQWGSQVAADSSSVMLTQAAPSDNSNFVEFLRAAVNGEIEITQRMKDAAASEFENFSEKFNESESKEIDGLLSKLRDLAA